MGHLGYLIGGFLLGLVLFVVLGFIFAFPWHFAALIALAILVFLGTVFIVSTRPPAPDPNRQAADLFRPDQ